MKLKGYKKENKITTKNMLIAFGIIIILMAVIGIYRTYAIYKLQKEYDVIKSKIGEFNNGDVKVAVLVDGEESSYFPTYEDNYKVESIECTNGVTGQWDVVNWRLIIDDMSATSTKCTISFNSNETNEETPIAYSKEELLALNESLTDEFQNKIEKSVLDKTYPVGSIYMSTEDDTVEKVKEKFGGTWVKYNEGRTLVGVGTGNDGTNSMTFNVNSTGGEYSHTLNVDEIPSHKHYIYQYYSGQKRAIVTTFYTEDTGWQAWKVQLSSSVGTGLTPYSGDLAVGLINADYTGGSQSHNNIQPYTAVYMYKRTA